MLDVCTIETPEVAAAVLDPLRNRLLGELETPASAASLSSRMEMPRQKINYHLRELERLGLATVAEERQWGGLTERRLVATASSYVISPIALGPIATNPERKMDRLAASYLVALAARAVHEIGDLIRRAHTAGKHLATLSVDTVIRFRSPEDRASFSRELTDAINELVAKYHDESAPGGRPHRLVLLAHPLPKPAESKEGDAHARQKG